MAVTRMLIAGRYRLLEPVGSGGMGRVWLARDEMLDRDVAVKEFVPPAWMTDEEQARLRTRTLREARSAARLNHPHVVRIYDVVHAADLPWIVMEYIPSRSLHQVVGEDGPYPPAAAARIGLDVLEAITAAHRAGVLHRDVKPHNVLIGYDGRVVLTDFGLATFVDDGSVTGPGMVVGSPQYVSPERARDGASTVESDLWSFGATLYAAVEGRSPFARDSAMATLMALATEDADTPVLAGPLAPVLAGLLRREPVERLTAVEVAERLRVIAAGVTAVPFVSKTFGRAAVPPARMTPEGQPGPAKAAGARPGPDVQPAPAGIEPVGGGLGAALAEALPGVADPPETAAQQGEEHPSEPLVPAQRRALPAIPPAQRSAPPETAPQPPTGHEPAADEPAHPPPARFRRWALVAAVVLAVVAGGAATGLALRGDGDPSRPGALGATSGAASPSGSGGSSGGFSPVNCASPAPAGLPRTPVAGAGKLRDGWSLYPGWSYFSDAGFHIAVPDGWTYQTIGTTICFRDPSNMRILSIDPNRSPQGDPVQACRKEVTRLRSAGDLKKYTELRIEPVPGLARAADWEYTYDGRAGERMHAMTRWRAANDGRAYAIGLITLDLDWPGNFEKWGMIQSTFFTDS